MCGILISILSHDSQSPPNWKDLKQANRNRGPDFEGEIRREFGEFVVTFYSSVLHLRGDEVCPQPVEGEDKVLMWNGEVYKGLDIPSHSSDTSIVAQALFEANDPRQVLKHVQGEWAFALFDSKEDKLWFGRDYLGRRSLQWKKSDGLNGWIISSVGLGEFQEVPADGIYSLSLDGKLTHYPWTEAPLIPLFSRLNSELPDYPAEVEVDASCIETFIETYPHQVLQMVEPLFQALLNAVKLRVCTIPAKDDRIAILFSGGIDCTVLAALTHLALSEYPTETIDLINVAFENPRALSHSKAKDIYLVPDRITAHSSLSTLQATYPTRNWRLIHVNVPFSEAMAAKPRVLELMHPQDTVMDLSIALAFYFAARAQGVEYTSKAKVLLSGLGADEQFGGYSRHKARFFQDGWNGLLEELQMDVDRISTRNLARDDRVCSDHGKEVRYPFLDEQVVQCLCDMPVYFKTDPRLGPGLGDKMLLRILAAHKLGLHSNNGNVWREKKRAIQFGAKTAKMTQEDSDVRGDYKIKD